MNTLTAEMIAAYPNAFILRDGKAYRINCIDVFCKDDLAIRIRDKNDINDWCYLHECKLILTSPDKITDEQALVVDKEYMNEERIDVVKNVLLEWDLSIDWRPNCAISFADICRSHNIDLGYKNIPSLIAAGLAVESKEVPV